MNLDIGHMRCPVCGTQTGARKNKNGIIYTYCPNGHHARLSREDSREAVLALESGKQWNNGVVYIYPQQKQTERKQENDGNNQQSTTGSNSSINYGRTNREPAADPTVDDRTTADSDTESDDFAFGLI